MSKVIKSKLKVSSKLTRTLYQNGKKATDFEMKISKNNFKTWTCFF